MQSQRSQSDKASYCLISTIWHSRKDETMETVKRSVVAQDLEGEGGKGDELEHKGFLEQWTILFNTLMWDTCH